MTDEQMVRHLLGRVLGKTVATLNAPRDMDGAVWEWVDERGYWHQFRPFTCMNTAMEIQVVIEKTDQLGFARELLEIVDPDYAFIRDQLAWLCANATARQRSIAAVRATGGEAE